MIFTRIHVSRTRSVRLMILRDDRYRRDTYAWNSLAGVDVLREWPGGTTCIQACCRALAEHLWLRCVPGAYRIGVSFLSSLEPCRCLRRNSSSNGGIDGVEVRLGDICKLFLCCAVARNHPQTVAALAASRVLLVHDVQWCIRVCARAHAMVRAAPLRRLNSLLVA